MTIKRKRNNVAHRIQRSEIASDVRKRMPNMSTNEETQGLLPFQKMPGTTLKKVIRNRFLSYKIGIAVLDLTIVLFAFGLSGWVIDSSFSISGNLSQSIVLGILSLVVLVFFRSFNLYSYHLIFFKKRHLASLIKAFCWGLLTLGIVLTIYFLPQMFSNKYFIFIIFLTAVGIMLLSRFFWDQLLNIIKSVGIAFLVVGMIGLINPDETLIDIINVRVIPVGFISVVVILMTSRYFLVHVVYSIWLRRYFRRQVAIIGSDEEAKDIVSYIVNKDAPYWVVGTVGRSVPDISIPKKNLGDLKKLPQVVEKNQIDELIVTDKNIDKFTLISLLDFCTNEGITVWFSHRLMPIIGVKLNIDNFCDLQMIRLCSQKNTWLFNKIKHGFDALITLPIFILMLPFFLLIAVAIKLNSKGPVFYKAKAVGKNGRIFSMFKFRSMKIDTNSDIHKNYVTKLISGEISNGGAKDKPLKITDDPRVSTVGKFIRKFSIDELPQLINVLKGDMSLIGPRPCLPYEYEIYKDWHKKRTTVRPGISGLWQVAGRSSVDFEDMILLDLYYIYNRSLTLDFNILYETIFVVLGRKGAY